MNNKTERGNIMTEFFLAAFPWIGMGLALAIVIAYLDARMKKNSKEGK